jgi:ATP-dependent DNA ligase
MSLRLHTRFIESCLPSPGKRPPAGSDWLHEIKHDGFRIMARRDGAGVRLLTRNGYRRHTFDDDVPWLVFRIGTEQAPAAQ